MRVILPSVRSWSNWRPAFSWSLCGGGTYNYSSLAQSRLVPRWARQAATLHPDQYYPASGLAGISPSTNPGWGAGAWPAPLGGRAVIAKVFLVHQFLILFCSHSCLKAFYNISNINPFRQPTWLCAGKCLPLGSLLHFLTP